MTAKILGTKCRRLSRPIQFDWRRNWKKRVEPLLDNPLVQGALDLGMRILDPDWKNGDPPHLLGRLDLNGGRIVEGKLSWYRPHGRCHWIVFFSYTIGLLNYPSLRWEIISGDLHTIAVGYDANNDPKVVMDILLFDRKTGEDSIRHAERKVGFPETNMAEFYEMFVDGLRRLLPLKASIQPARSHDRREAADCCPDEFEPRAEEDENTLGTSMAAMMAPHLILQYTAMSGSLL
jgi:hypothetical protein